ncbi:Autophagy protein 7 [Vermiconidia calcicola]|uniref:Autophagy protein 7 n=1 Tax=Vermiconidia calcicola TaxID=1690605 RepID=A0ACC3MIV7_9PEZI|nr:Autophagy protein 7 [Vermiconidia calcicola]
MPSTHPLQYAPWTSDIELAFYSALASIKINHDKLDSSARKVLGVYEINHKDPPERSTRMQIHGTALTTDESALGYYRAEGVIRNFNTIEEFRQVDKAAHIELAGRTIWDAVNDGTIYSCPSLLSSFSAICFADLKKYRFTYHFAYPAVHSDPVWRLHAPETNAESGTKHLKEKETEDLVNTVQTWRYSVDSRQHGFFLAKRLRKDVLEAEWRMGRGEIEEEEEDGNMKKPTTPKVTRSSSLSELGFLWSVGSLSSYENGFFDNAEEGDRFVCFADPSTYPSNPGWMLRNLLILVRQRWHMDKVQVMCYRDTHLRRDHQSSLVMTLQSAEPVFHDQIAQQLSRDMPTLGTSTALRPGEVDAAGELIEHHAKPPEPAPERPKKPLKVPPMPKVTGWERNEHSKIVSRTVDLASYLDPSRLADQAVDLNLKLIKWRISPSIDLDTIKTTSCLLLGAGTLGSYVARNLMGWGVRKITFVDNARVSYSNPVRQPLYEFKDCLEGGSRKAERAAEALQQIYPGVNSEGYYMSVPMAGHPIMDEERTKKEFDRLKSLIESHDAVFLLMDTRESRWLPSVMAKAAGKIVINAALGFDTYVVMRHGIRNPSSKRPQSSEGSVLTHEDDQADPLQAAASDTVETKGPVRSASLVQNRGEEQGGEELGCYFCSDVVAPADSLKSATLDQQCTVTRPGIAPMASALAVELLVSMTQHRLRGRAPAPDPVTGSSGNQIQSAPPTDPSLPNSHPLGTVPHQLRAYLSTWQTIQVKGKAYDCCAACSPSILGAYEKDGWDFVKRAINERGYVEEISGLAEVQRLAEEADKGMDDWSEGEDEGEGELV